MSEPALLDQPAPSGWLSIHLADERPDTAELEQAGVRVAEIDGSAIASKLELMAALAEALLFPEYFGANWDAVDECLRDLGSRHEKARGHLLVIEQGEALWRREPELCGMLVRAWTEAAEFWREKSVPFHLVFVR
jgi:hypothetical protein